MSFIESNERRLRCELSSSKALVGSLAPQDRERGLESGDWGHLEPWQLQLIKLTC